MESIDGIAELHMSGTRAVFLPEKGVKISESSVADAFEQRGMKLEFYGEVLRPRARARYTANAPVT